MEVFKYYHKNCIVAVFGNQASRNFVTKIMCVNELLLKKAILKPIWNPFRYILQYVMPELTTKPNLLFNELSKPAIAFISQLNRNQIWPCCWVVNWKFKTIKKSCFFFQQFASFKVVNNNSLKKIAQPFFSFCLGSDLIWVY